MNFTIRKLEKRDLKAGLLESLSFLFKVELTLEEAEQIFDEIARNPNHLIFIAESNGEVLGSVTLLIEPKFVLKGSRFGYLEDLSVKEVANRSLIGLMLVKRVIEEARKVNCRLIRLDCNDYLAKFYEQNGFRRKPHVNRMQIDLLPPI